MKKIVLIVTCSVLAACTGFPMEPGGPEFRDINGTPGVVFRNPQDVLLVTGDEETGAVTTFDGSNWTPAPPEFPQGIPDDPDLDGALIVPQSPTGDIAFGRGDDPAMLIPRLDQNPCRPDVDGCGGTFGRSVVANLSRFRSGELTVWICPTQEVQIDFPTEEWCNRVCGNTPCEEKTLTGGAR